MQQHDGGVSGGVEVGAVVHQCRELRRCAQPLGYRGT